MKTGFVLLLVVAGVAGGVGHDSVLKQWKEIFPSDVVHQDALARCSSADHNFNRLSSMARDACYQRWLQPTVAATGRPPILSMSNPIDIEASRGARQGDIRQEQASDFYRQVRHLDR